MPIDMSAATAPPKRAGRTPSTRAASTPRTPAIPLTDQRFAGLNGLGQLAQGACLLTKQYAQAATFGMHWQPIAKELAVLSDTQPTIARYVDLVITAGPYAALITAGMPFIMQTMANFGLINASNAMGSIVPPNVLEAQMKADLARMETEALRAQQEAMREAARAQQEYQRVMAESQADVDAARAEEVRDGVNNRGWDPNIHPVNAN